MNIKKNIAHLAVLLLILAGSACLVKAQQDPMYTQYMDNLLIINPGYAGTQKTGDFMVVARNQWVAFEGAPKTRTFSFNTPIKNLGMGIGFSILSDEIGPLNQTGVYLDYSYRVKLDEKYQMSLGLKAGFSFYRAALSELETVSPDPIFERDIFKNFLPNFGVGGFIFSDDAYLGVSVPKLVENIIGRENYISEYVGKEKIHLYAVAGKTFEVNENIHVKGASMLKIVKNAPISFDITAMAGLKERFWLGAMMRMGNSWGLLAQVNATDDLLVGYSYDLNFTGLNAFNNGTHEIMLRYSINLFSGSK